MKKIFLVAIIGLILTSCDKEFEERNITYRFEQGPKTGVVSYLYEDSLYTESFDVTNVQFKLWEKTLKGRQGDPVYMYMRYPFAEGNSFQMMTFKASIIVDGKAIKEAVYINNYDTLRVAGTKYYYLRLYGTVPF